MMNELPLNPTTRILTTNKNFNYAKEAKETFRTELEKIGEEISAKAVELARKDGRKTVMEKDIRRWRTITEETEMLEGEFIYKDDNGRIRFFPKTAKYGKQLIGKQYMSLKYLDKELLFNGKLYKLSRYDVEDEARKIMESHESRILASLMEPHWAYNIYEFRGWRSVEKVNDKTKMLTMWFDDYDGGDVFIEGHLFED